MNSTYQTIINLIKFLGIGERIIVTKNNEKNITICISKSLTGIYRTIHLNIDKEYCPYCSSIKIVKNGKYKNNRQRYKCKECKKNFNDYTGTSLHYLHKLEDVKPYLKLMLEKKSIRAISKILGCSIKKAFAWRHKFLYALKFRPNVYLKDEIQSDDTYILISFKGLKNLKQIIGRKGRKRGGKARKRGISNDLATLLAAIDKHKNFTFKLVGKGRLTKSMVKNTLNNVIHKCKKNATIFVTDSHSSYQSFAKSKNLVHEEILASSNNYITPNGYHINNVNNLHQRYKRFLHNFIGVATGYMQHYLDYFKVKNEFKDDDLAIPKFYKLLLCNDRVFIKYKSLGQLNMVNFLPLKRKG